MEEYTISLAPASAAMGTAVSAEEAGYVCTAPEIKKEISALRLMVQSYTNNPKFGDASKFQSELDSAIYNVQVDISIFYHFLPF